MLKGHHKWCMELFRVDFSLRPSICRCPFRFYLVPNTLFRSVSQCISGIERKGFKWDEIKEFFFWFEFTLMCWTFGVNFGVNCDSTSPIRMRLLKIFRIFMMRTMVASIKCRRSSSIRWSVCLFSALRSDSILLVISNRIFGLSKEKFRINSFAFFEV